MTRVFRSSDNGSSWTAASVVNGAFWSTLFVHRDALYLLGSTKEYGDTVIRRSNDGGFTWTTPSTAATGLLAGGGQYHCAPMPVISHDGRLWRAMERRVPASGWGTNFCAGMLSVPENADLLDAANWTISNLLPSDTAWLGGKFGGWLEGNAVVEPGGNLVNILRVHQPDYPEAVAVVSVSRDGLTLLFDPSSGFRGMPGGAKKFAIRHDPASGRYWSLVSHVPAAYQNTHPSSTRNTLALVSSPDLVTWTNHGTILSHPDVLRHGFQYVEWIFDGDDIIATCRTAFDDTAGGAPNYHDANHLTFHRVRNFRNFGDEPLPRPWRHAFSRDGDLLPDGDEDGDGFTNHYEYLAGSNPLRERSTPARMGEKALVALAGGSGVDFYQVSAAGDWAFERQLTGTSYQSLVYHDGFLYGAAFDQIHRIDPVTGAATSIATRNAGGTQTAGWTSADTQQLAVGPDGLLYFSTAFGTAAGQGVFRLATDGSSFARFVDRTGASWELNNARGLAWTGSRWLVSSRAGSGSTNRPVYEFDATGQYVRTLRNDLRAPQGLLVDGGNVKVASLTGSLTALDASTGDLAGLVSGLPSMNAMSAVELFGEAHVVTYQHGIWRHRERSSLTRSFTPANSQHSAMVVLPRADPYREWIDGYEGITEKEEMDDPDDDGVPNRLEFLLGWDPSDGTSRFAASCSMIGDALHLSWPGGAGAVFTVRSSTDLEDWSTIETVVTGAGQTIEELELPLPVGASRFYRVEWTP